MSKEIALEIITWAESNDIKIDKELMSNAPDDKYEFNNSLVTSLKGTDSGHWRDSYEGRHPEGFMAELIQGILSTVKDKSISLISLSSNDAWETANLILKTDDTETELLINDAGGEDPEYASPEIFPVLENYVKENCPNKLKGIFSDAGYIYFYLTDKQINELDQIISKIPEPDYG